MILFVLQGSGSSLLMTTLIACSSEQMSHLDLKVIGGELNDLTIQLG